MSKYTTYYNTRQAMYKDLAANWSKFTENMELTEEQRRGMSLFFKPIAKRFGLVKEFRSLTVI